MKKINKNLKKITFSKKEQKIFREMEKPLTSIVKKVDYETWSQNNKRLVKELDDILDSLPDGWGKDYPSSNVSVKFWEIY